LPCRGQRTRTNARTRKGPKKTVDDKEMVPQDGTPFDAKAFRRHMRGELP